MLFCSLTIGIVLACVVEVANAASAMDTTQPVSHDLHSSQATRTYILTNAYWWESMDHQLTTVLTLLAFARNISATPIIPFVEGMADDGEQSFSLIGDYYDLNLLNRVQPALTLHQFKRTQDYAMLREELENNHTLFVPSPSKKQYLQALQLPQMQGTVNTSVSFGMPHEDLENTDMYCSSVPGTVFYISKHHSTTVRFIFLGHIHFYHFCSEKFMPWWYTVRTHIAPRPEYYVVADAFLASLPKPVTVVHIRDVMDHQVVRSDDEIELYAQQIADAVRKSAPFGTFYLAFSPYGRSVVRVASLLESEFPQIAKCQDYFDCGQQISRQLFEPQLPSVLFHTLFETSLAPRMLEITLSTRSQYFIGNIYSPNSRHIGLHRKLRGQSYHVLRGFSELRKVWRWHL